MPRRVALFVLAALAIAGAAVPAALAAPAHKRTKPRRARAICRLHKPKRPCTRTRRNTTLHVTLGRAGPGKARPAAPTPRAPSLPAPPPRAVPSSPSVPVVSAPPVSNGLIVGLDASVAGWANMPARMAQVASQAGPKWIRQDFNWYQIEPQSGTFDFSHYDQFMLLTAQYGVHVLPLMLGTPRWAGATANTIPADPSAYATFVAAVVARYGPHGSFWTEHPSLAGFAIQTFELWNEPYYDNGNNSDYDPARYARLVRAAALAGRQTDASVHFLLAAENQAEYVGGTWVWWIDALYQAVPDLNDYFDGVAVHPYGTNLSDVSFPTPGQAYDGYEQIRRVEAIQREFAAHGAGGKPLWITEIGWPTCTSGSDRCTTPAGQAANLATVFNLARTSWRSFVQAVFVYSFDDSDPDSSDPEHDYGLAYNDGTPKPALAVFRTQAATS